ncbi:MAG TPA: hypothetical protein VG795_12585 [Acidimicrobiia bacterium]|nr:hypothetical protein [Acidimicrobiia bacterium]
MRIRLISGLVIGLLVLGACSSDDETPEASEAGGETTEAETPKGLDAGFGQDGVLALPLSPDAHDRLLAVANGPDGSAYAAGWTSPGGDNAMVVAKIGSDGKLDTAFGQDGLATVNVAVGGKTVEVARAVAVDPDGKIVIAGPVEKDPKATGAAAKDTNIAVVRFDASGKPDSSFGKGGTAVIDIGPGKAVGESYVADNSWGMAALAGGRVVVFGSTAAADRNDADYAIVGLTKAGALDPAFGTKGITKVDVNGATDNARAVVAQSDGKLVFAGYSRNSEGVIDPVLIRTGADGKLDSGFGKEGVATASVVPGGIAEAYGVALQGDKFVLAGYGRGSSADEKVDLMSMRFNADGSWDKSYGTDGLTRIDVAGDADRGRNVAVLPDGRILVVGSGSPEAGKSDGMVVLLDKEGKPTSRFGTDGRVLSDLGGPGDAWFGLTQAGDGKSVTVVGYKGADPAATDGSKDDAAVARIAL